MATLDLAAYEDIRCIGKGSFGAAVLVRRKQDGKEFVVKRIDVGGLGKSEADSAMNEVAVLSGLKHPNIIAYYGSVVKRGTLHILLAYAAGGDLAQRIAAARARRAHFAEPQVLDWFWQVASALHHVHAQRILHRDLKTQPVRRCVAENTFFFLSD